MAHPEFPLDSSLIYLNHAAVAPWPKRTAIAVKAFADENISQGAADYPRWLRSESKLRKQLKEMLNAPSTDDIALVKNTSEALSFVAYGLDWSPGDNIVSSNEEFPSNRIPWQSLSEKGVEFREVELAGTKDPEEALFALVNENTRLITISSVQFASGIRLDLEKIGNFCRQNNVLFCIDAIQSLGALEFDVQRYKADFVMADGHKWLLGPEGLGVFYTTPAARDKLRLTQFGWHMIEAAGYYENVPWKVAKSARRFECGSPNMLGIMALSESLSLLLEMGMDSVEQKVLDNSRFLVEQIQSRDDLELLSTEQQDRCSGIIVFRHQSINNNKLFQLLKDCGVICAQRGGGIRLSPHFYTDRIQLKKVFEIVPISH